MSQAQDKKDRPDTRNHASEAMLSDVVLMRDVMAGTTHMREQRTRYLPSHPKERGADYNRRLAMAVLFNALQRTVSGLAGMVFRRNITLGDDVPGKIVELSENIDNAGTHLDVFARELFEDSLLAGHAGILVDVPTVESGGRRLMSTEEQALGVRPYWVAVPKENIISWRTTVDRGAVVLSQLVIYEPVIEPDGLFGEVESKRYRVLRRDENKVVTSQLWEIQDDKAVALDEPRVVTNQTEIPFSLTFGGGKRGHMESRPALLDLAHTNIAHYQDLADHRYVRHLGNVPILVISGVDGDSEIVIAANTALKLPDPQSSAAYCEPSGNSYKANVEQLNEYKADMAAMGLAMLQRETRAAETAEAKRLDKATEESALATAARSLSDCLERSLQFTANFLRIEDGGSVNVNMEFDDDSLSPQQIAEYRAMVLEGSLSLDTLWQIMQQGDALPRDFDADAEKDRIAEDATRLMAAPEEPEDIAA